MAHADHFLQRLGRIEAATEVDFALGLYRDQDLLRYVLSQVRLPEGASRVALSLKDGARGPYLLVDREGAFITCLAEGMQHDLPVIERQHLDHIVGKVRSVREKMQLSEQLVRESGGIKFVLDRLLTAGGALGREEFEAFSVWRPIVREGLVRLFFDHAAEILDSTPKIEGLLRQKVTPSRRKRLHGYCQRVWALGHLGLLFADDDRDFLNRVFDETPGIAFALPYILFKRGVGALGLRGAWMAAKIGRPFLDQHESDEPGPMSRNMLIGTLLSLTAVGIRHRKLRGRARRALTALDDTARLAEWSRPIYEGLIGICLSALDDPDKLAGVALRQAKIVMVKESEAHDEGSPRHFGASEDQIPDDLARAFVCSHPYPYLASDAVMPILLASLCWVARAGAEELYLPKEIARAFFEPWSLGEAAMILRGIDVIDGQPLPVRAKPKPGRNQPCPCGSGRKYKRCCG